MHKILKSPFFLQTIYIVVGLIGLVLMSFVFKDKTLVTLFTFAFFLVGYIIVARLLKRRTDIIKYWKPHKIFLFFIGIILGVIIQISPYLFQDKNFYSNLSVYNLFHYATIYSLFMTLLIVAWEELWFRNPILNLATHKYKQIYLSIFTGLLFMALHLMNPKINILIEGPELFLAGACLTLAYYVSRSFYMPLGIHYGNNMLESMIRDWMQNNINQVDVTGSGITILILLLFMIILILIRLNKGSSLSTL